MIVKSPFLKALMKPMRVSSKLVYPNLSKIKLRLCTKCGRGGREIQRHHKGHEFLFANILPSKYEKRYSEFRKEDVTDLCDRCHRRAHVIYANTLGRLGFWTLLAKQNGKLTFVQCEHYRKILIKECHVWLAQRNKLTRLHKK